jgi:type IV secretion system protein VirB11
MPGPRASPPSCPKGRAVRGLLPPVVAAPAFAIRKPAVAVFTLDDYAAAGIMSAAEAAACRDGVAARANILVAGGTGSGKTTLVNALLVEVAKTTDRIVLIEDTRELQCAAPNLVAMRTKDGVVSLSDLVRSSLRLRPDRIPIGEVRGAEALDLLKAWGTGHPGGIGTIHAGTALGALRRMEQLIQEAVVTVPRALLAETIDLIAVLVRDGHGRRLAELARVEGLDAATGDYRLTPLTTPRPETCHDQRRHASQDHEGPPARRHRARPPRPYRHHRGRAALRDARPCGRIVDAVGGAAPVYPRKHRGAGRQDHRGDDYHRDRADPGLRRYVGRGTADDPDRVRSVDRVRRVELLPLVLFLRWRSDGRMTGAADHGEPIAGYFAPVHRALTEPILLGGAPRSLAIVNGTLAGAIGLGLRLWIAGLAIWAIGHALSVWAARRDPQFVDVARRHLRYPTWMQP